LGLRRGCGNLRTAGGNSHCQGEHDGDQQFDFHFSLLELVVVDYL
jgi:hypothetical protein